MGKNRVLHLSWLCGNKIFGKHHQEMSSYPDLLANQGVYVPFFLLGYVSHLEKGHGFNVEEQNLWLGVSPIYPLPVLRIRNCALNLYTCIPIGKDFVHVFSLRFHQIHSNPIYTLAKKNMSIPWKFHSTSKFHSHPKKKTSTNIVTHIHIITIITHQKSHDPQNSWLPMSSAQALLQQLSDLAVTRDIATRRVELFGRKHGAFMGFDGT